MPRPTNKTDLLAAMDRERSQVETVLDPLAPARMVQPGVVGEWSVKDVLAHLAEWEQMALGWYRAGLRGDAPDLPAPGYKWNELKRYNADLRKSQADLDWPAALAMLRDRHGKLLDWMRERSQDELYGGPMKGANNAWTPGRWAEAAGPSHYRSAHKYIRSRLKGRA